MNRIWPPVTALAIFLGGLVAWATPSAARLLGQTSDGSPSPASAERANGVPAPRVKILVSKETTRILEPLGKDGVVDYVAALNRYASAGVTPENNAGVLFVQTFGAPEFKGTERVLFFQRLGIKPLPEAGDYFKSLRPLSKDESTNLEQAELEPWKPSDFPLFAEWLKSNERPLALVVKGTRRDRCFIPWVLPPRKPLMYALLPTEQASREWCRALVLRAMLKLNDGNVAGAKEDLLACHRLGRLIGSSPCLIGGLVGAAIDSVAFGGDVALMEHVKLTARDALAYQAELRALPRPALIADTFDRYERMVLLDTMKSLAIGATRDTEVAARFQTLDPQAVSERLSDYWNAVLRVWNEAFDEWSAAARQRPQERQRSFDRLGEKLKHDASEILGKELFDKVMAGTEAQSVVDQFLRRALGLAADRTKASKLPGSVFKTTTPAECGRQIGKVLVCLMLPAINAACGAEDRARARQALEQVGLALAAYRADHGHFPARLKALVPKYIAAVPADPCTGEPLRYEWRVDRYLLFSRGTNGVDEDGRTFDSKPPGDDVVLQIPRTPPIDPRHPGQNAER